MENLISSTLYLIFLLNEPLQIKYIVAERREFRMTKMIGELKQAAKGMSNTLSEITLKNRILGFTDKIQPKQPMRQKVSSDIGNNFGQ